MADKTKEELEQEASDALVKANQEFADAQREDAEQTRADNPPQGETDEEYQERIRQVNATGIFGDTETAIEQQVPSSNNEQASVALAEKDAAAEADPDSEEAQASDDEARRQVDAVAHGETAEEVDAAADDNESEDDESTEGEEPAADAEPAEEDASEEDAS